MQKTSRNEAKQKIEDFFLKENFTAEEMRKIKRLAMRFNIKLGDNKKKFCKKCLAKLRGKTRITKASKIVICETCGKANRYGLRA